MIRTESLAQKKTRKHTRNSNGFVDASESINEYLDRRDWRVNANANQGYSLGGLILNISGKMTANYWLSHLYTPEIEQAHRSGDLHIHDLDMLAGYCAGWSLPQTLPYIVCYTTSSYTTYSILQLFF